MPHIAILYPFVKVGEFAEIAAGLQAALRQISPFTFSLESYDVDDDGRSTFTVYLRPNTDGAHQLIDLQAQCESVVPFCNDLSALSGGFSPKLTIGQFQSRVDLNKFMSTPWETCTCVVDRVYLVYKSGPNSSFQSYFSVTLGASSCIIPHALEPINCIERENKYPEEKEDESTIFVQCGNFSLNASAHTLPCDEDENLGEQFFQLKLLHLPDTHIQESVEETENRALVAIAADCSGSMSGRPWEQVCSALKSIIISGSTNDSVDIELILYNDSARAVTTPDAKSGEEMVEKVTKILANVRPGSTTNFSSAFSALQQVIQRRIGIASNGLLSRILSVVGAIDPQEASNYGEIIVVFMTDGQDTTTNDVPKAMQDFSTFLHGLSCQNTVHTIGFGCDHNLEFLDALRTQGKSEGLFRYAEPSDGLTALHDKFIELYDFIETIGSRQKVVVCIELPKSLCAIQTNQQGATLEGEGEGEGERIIRSSVALSSEGQGVIETWVAPTKDAQFFVEDPESPEDVVLVTIHYNQELFTAYVPLIFRNDTKSTHITILRMHRIDFKIDQITALVAKELTKDNQSNDFIAQIFALQSKVDKIRNSLFEGKTTKKTRESVLNLTQDVQKKIDALLRIVAEYERGQMGVPALARAKDLHFSSHLSKARRQRIMDTRLVHNIRQASSLDKQLKQLTVDRDFLSKFPEDARHFFMCTMSQLDLEELLTDPDEPADVLGFGLSVVRPEVVVDEPTQIKVMDVSTTLVCRSAFEDAIRYAMNLDDRLMSFSIDVANPAVALRGRGREPINSWLPLYITESHWRRVKILLKNVLGAFCTMDPMGFVDKQYNVMFHILGMMLGHTSGRERETQLLFAFQRTCAQMVIDFNMVDRLETQLCDFLLSPSGRSRDVVPSLPALLGILASLPGESIRRVFLSDTNQVITTDQDKARLNPEDMDQDAGGNICSFVLDSVSWQLWWLAIMEEFIRRGFASLVRDINEQEMKNITFALLYGVQPEICGNKDNKFDKSSTMDLLDILDELVIDKETRQQILEAKESEFKESESKTKENFAFSAHSSVRNNKTDESMSFLARRDAGVLPGGTPHKVLSEKVNRAEERRKEWISQCSGDETDLDLRSELGMPETIDPFHIEHKHLTAMALFNHISRAFPSLLAIRNAKAVLDLWIGKYVDEEKKTESVNTKKDIWTWPMLDENYGLCPPSWIDSVKDCIASAEQHVPDAPRAGNDENMHSVGIGKLWKWLCRDLPVDSAPLLRAVYCQALHNTMNR